MMAMTTTSVAATVVHFATPISTAISTTTTPTTTAAAAHTISCALRGVLRCFYCVIRFEA